MKQKQKQKKLLLSYEKCKRMLVNIVKEHELIDAKKRLEEAAPKDENKVLKKA